MELLGCMFIAIVILWGALAIAANVIDGRNRAGMFRRK